MAKSPAVILDRDGTLIVEREYLKDPKGVRLLPGAAAALRRLNKAGYPLVVITNQSGVGRGYISRSDVERVHQRLRNLLRKGGANLSAIRWCPHRPNQHCACRKPKLKLVRQAARTLGRPWKGSISVGDKWIDVQIGQRTGGRGVLVLTGYGRRMLKQKAHPKPDFVASNIKAAAQWIINSEKRNLS